MSLWKQVANNKSLLFFSLAITFVIAYTFLSDYFPKYSSEYIEYKKKYNEIISKRDLDIKNAIKGSDIEEIITKIKNESNSSLKKFHVEFKKIKEKNSINGYTSEKNFFLGTSRNLFSFVLSLIILFLILNHNKIKLYKKYLIGLSFILVITAGYWLSWSLLKFSIDPKRPFDFPRSSYNFCLFVLPSFIFIICYLLFKKHIDIEQKFKNTIKKIFRYVFEVSDDLKEDTKSKNKIKLGKIIKEAIDEVG